MNSELPAGASSDSALHYSSGPLWLVAALCIGVYIAAFFPGAMSFDSAYQWWQARSGDTSDVHAAGLMLLFRFSDPWLPGPAIPFLLHLGMFWLGLVLIVESLPLGNALRIGMLVVVAATPVCALLFSHVWSDVGLMAALTLAFAGLLRWRDQGNPLWLLPILLMLLYALLLRHNAAMAVLPLAIYTAMLWRARQAKPGAMYRYAIGGTLLFAALLVVAGLIGRAAVKQHIPVWPALALWDLAGMSVETDELLIPAEFVGLGMSVGELRVAYVPWSNTPLFERTRSGVRHPFALPWPDADLQRLTSAWLDAIRKHPGAYLRHRARLSAALFGTHAADWPVELIYVDAEVQYRDNPAIAPNRSALHQGLMQGFADLRATAALAAWPYLLLGLVVGLLAWRRRSDLKVQAVLVILLSGALYALPLPLIAPAAELRYLGWSCLASLLSAVLMAAHYLSMRPLKA